MKKNYFKKSLSLIMTVLMIMSCWVFVPGEHQIEADALANVNTYRKADKYGTPYWDGSNVYYSKWNSGGSYTTIKWAKHIYLDISETLQSAGYYYDIEWYYGSGTDYRIINNGFIFGGYGIGSGWPNNYYTMTNMFNNYSLDGSLSNGGSQQTTNVTDGDLFIGVSGLDWDGAKTVIFRSRKTTNNEKIFMLGTPKSVGTGRYSTSGNKPSSFGGWQQWKSNKWQSASDKYTKENNSANWTTDCYEGDWKEVAFDITIYDKSTLSTTVNEAKNIINNLKAKYTYQTYNNLVNVYNQYASVLTTRVNTQSNIDNANTQIRNAINALKERTYELTYENLFSLSDWYNSNSYAASNGTLSIDLNAGEITLKNNKSSGEVTTSHSGDSESSNTRDTFKYAIPVDGGKEYTLRYSTDHNDTQMFAFFYNEDGGCSHPGGNYGLYNFAASNGEGKATFKAPSNATYMEFRFDNNAGGTTATFWDIMIYETERAKEIDLEKWPVRPHRVLYSYNEALTASKVPVPQRTGYDFDHWYLAVDGSDLSQYYNAYNFSASYVVYSNWKARTLDVGYDNLFSVSDWYYAALEEGGLKTNRNGAITADLEKGTISIENPANSNDQDNNYVPWGYDITVEPNTEYVFVFDADIATAEKNGVQYHLFENASADVSGSWIKFPTPEYLRVQGKTTGNMLTFTTSATTTNINIRLGTVDAYGVTNTFSNIGLYKKADYDAYIKDYAKIREPFRYGDTDKLMTLTREGYVFDGWFTADGKKLTSVEGLSESTIVYAAWTKLCKVTFLDDKGNFIKSIYVENGGSVADEDVPKVSKPLDKDGEYSFDGWDGSYTNVTSDVTLTPIIKKTPHGNFYYSEINEADCVNPAYVYKFCGNCDYPFGAMYYDGTDAYYLAKGHMIEGQPAISGSATADGLSHKVKCGRVGCNAEVLVDHTNSLYPIEGSSTATCTTPGKITYGCACGYREERDSEKDPNAHNYDYTKGTPNGDNKTHTVACTYNSAHTLTDVACSDTDKNCYCDICGQELEHKYVNKTTTNVVTEAACGVDAVYYLTCQCGKYDTATWTDTGSALEHEWAEVVDEELKVSDANCTDGTVYYKKCSLCGAAGTDTWMDDDFTGHKFDGDYVSSNNGKHTQKCTNKDCTATGNEADCEYGAWSAVDATTHKHTCKYCSYTPAAVGHDWAGWVSTDDNKTEAGTQKNTCKVCNYTTVETDCSYVLTDSGEVSCTTDAFETYTCSDCGHGYTVILEKRKGHNYTGEYKYNADTDKHQQLCVNGCGTYGEEVACTWTYTTNNDNTHKATCVCGNSFDEACTGGQATCTDKAVCDNCETAYGATTDHSFKGNAVVLEGDFHAYECEYCQDKTDIYGVGSTVGGKEACSGGEATCTALAICKVCGDTHGALKADAHKWGAWTNVADTETHTRVCEYDNAHTETEACFSATLDVITPDCETGGYTINTCEFCGHKWNTGATEPLGHDWSAWTNNVDGTHTRTCQDPTCKYGEDGKAKVETVACTADDEKTVVTDPTCLADGYTTYTCKDCGYVWVVVDEGSATGHSYTEMKKSATAAYLRSTKDCVTALTYWYKCDNCSVSAGTEKDKYENEVDLYWTSEPATGHAWSNTATAEYLDTSATCTAKAVYYKSCSVCGKSSKGTEFEAKFEFGAPKGHKFDAEIATEDYLKSDATCTAKAVYYVSCSVCDATSKDTDDEKTFEYGDLLGHDFDHDDDGVIGNEGDTGYTAAKEADCSNAGVKAHYTCQRTDCNKKFEDEAGTKEIKNVTISAKGHDWKYVDGKAATCDEDGYTWYNECSRCQLKDANYRVIEKKGHDFKEGNGYYVDTVNNYHAYKCSRCEAYGADGVKYTVEYDGLDIVIKGGVACNFTGEYVQYEDNGIHSHKLLCVCGNETSEACEDKDPKVVEPTCGKDGYSVYTCEDCGFEWTVEAPGTARAHQFGDWTKADGDVHIRECIYDDCNAYETEDCYTEEEGVTTECGKQNVCDVCGDYFGTYVEHSWVADDSNTEYRKSEATCTSAAIYYYSCKNCGHSSEGTLDERTFKSTKEPQLAHNLVIDSYNISEWKNPAEGFDASILAEPTCDDEGKAITYCKDCDYYKLKTVTSDGISHNWGEWVSIGGNCATGVTSKRKCSICHKEETKTESVAHSWKVIFVAEAGCTTNGFIELACSVCGAAHMLKGEKVDDYVLDGINYTPDDTTEQEALENKLNIKADYKVIAEGSHAWVKETTEDVDYINDKNGNVIFVEKYPSYNAKGRGYLKCSKCSTTEEVSIDAYGTDPKNHKHPEYGINDNSTLRTVAYLAPTCTTSGHLEYKECTRCSYNQYVIDNDAFYLAPLDHSDNDNNGKCDDCDKTLSGDKSDKCSCICHKESGFMKFIYKILKFFWKLFGSNKTCDCSKVHY